MRDVRHYRLFGLKLRSTIELPELQPGAADGENDVEIEEGEVPVSPAASHVPVSTPAGVILPVEGVGRFLIMGGRRIIVDRDPAASARNVRLFLLGSVIGIVLHQRGLLPLHANAVEFQGRAILFLGASGAGKSTLAAAFHDRGHRVLSDDVCVVTADGERFVAHPGIPRLRLWRDAIERSGRNPGAYERAFDAVDKFTVGIGGDSLATPMPVGAIFLLRRGEPEGEIAFRRLSGMAGAQALIENIYRGGFIRAVTDSTAHYHGCIAVTRAVPIAELTRPWNVSRIDGTFADITAYLDESVA